MIRIIQGLYKGRSLKIPDSKITRPTMNIVRQAIFNIIQFDIKNTVCLDLFSGSGALGIEALSRGAKKVYFNDVDKTIYKLILDNLNSIKIKKEDFQLDNLDYLSWIKKYTGSKLDIVFLDPPYNKINNIDVINLLIKNMALSPTSIIVTEQKQKNQQVEGFKLSEYCYSEKYVGVYRKLN